MYSSLRLQVQALWLTLSLGFQHSLSCSAEVFHIDAHSALAESHETGFGADGLDVGTGEVVLLIDKFIKIDVFIKGHLRSVKGEDLLLSRFWTWVSQKSDANNDSVIAYDRGSQRESFGRYDQDELGLGQASRSCWWP